MADMLMYIDENFFPSLADIMREKTGRTEKMLPAEMLVIAEEEWGAGSTSPTRTELMSETLAFSHNDTYGMHAWFSEVGGATFAFNAGETYIVVWDGTEYTITAETASLGGMTATGVGNKGILGLGDNTGEPFLFAYSADYNQLMVFTTETAEKHAIAVYQETGGSSNLVKYVTFMSWDGTTELYKKPTIAGDDCVNVVSKGLLAKPTKESSNTTNYTHNGWSLTPGGSADSSALKNITEDRILYAAFAESVRYYTVNFYTEAGVLHETVQVEYGGTANPSVEPTKSGYGFNGWSPSNENITANTDCYAIWTESITFANASWDYINEVAMNKTASAVFAVGDTKDIEYDGATLTLEIVDFDHDELADGSGTAGITIICKQMSTDKFKWTSGSATVRYNNSLVCTGLNSTILNKLPADLQNIIKSVNKDFVDAPSKSSAGNVSMGTVALKIWNPSATELGYADELSSDFTFRPGNVYERFRDVPCANNIIVGNASVDITSTSYWLRDAYITSNGNYWMNNKYCRILVASNTGDCSLLYYEESARSIIGFCI